MFGGVGGFRLGLERANTTDWEHLPERACGWRSIRQEMDKSYIKSKGGSAKNIFECVGYAEIDKYAVKCYNQNFGESHEPTDVATIDWSRQPDFDLLCAGFPCQPFSVAGKRMGFEDTRGTLFFEIARCVGEKRPRFLLLENVKGLLSHDKGKTFATILATLDELGYDAEWQVLNSKDFGVPQNRERVFIFGWRRDENIGGVFPIFPRGERVVLADVLEKEVDEKYYLKPEAVERLVGKMHSQDTSYAIDANYHKGVGSNLDKKRRQVVVVADRYRMLAGGWSKSSRRWGVEARFTEGMANTINTGTGGGNQSTLNIVVAPGNAPRIRRLTPTETERLQGFPDGWTAMLSDTRRYKAMGNAVTVNVIEAIGRGILRIMEDAK